VSHEESSPAALLCKNCGAALQSRYCAECGQRADVHVPSTTEIAHEALEGITHSDSRLWRTLQTLWFRPGELTLEFVRGRRVAYLPPFRLYLVLSLLCFLAISLVEPQADLNFVTASDVAEGGTKRDTADCEMHSSIKSWEPALRHACLVIKQDRGQSLLRLAIASMPKAMFIFLPIIAFLHMLLYWRPWHRYAVHLLFFVHVHAFAFSVLLILVLLSVAANAWRAVEHANTFLMPVLLTALPVYGLLAMRRVFQRRWLNTLFKAVLLSIIYLIAISITITGVFVYSALHL
jgi:Protein of unknown function (DUF3667)